MPGRPDQNGRPERMHRTLKAETAKPPRSSMRAQQRCFDAFLDEYNNERPHEAIGQSTPSSLYQPSPRTLPKVLPELEYPEPFEMGATRKVYTEFRQDAVHLLKTTDRSFVKVAEDLGVSVVTLRQWYKRGVVSKKSRKQRKAETAKFHGEETPERKLARLERENAALQKEIDSQRMDREILKKAAAFFAKESE